MAFALIFLVFFIVDILIFFRFQLFGLIPINMLFSAILVFIVWLLIRNAKLVKQNNKSLFFSAWMILLAVLITDRLFFTLMKWEPFMDPSFIGYLLINILAVIASLFVVTVTYTSWHRNHEFYFWFLYSSIMCLIRAAIDLFVTFPMWLYRFSGVLDLPLMFGLLMIASHVIRLKVETDVSPV